MLCPFMMCTIMYLHNFLSIVTHNNICPFPKLLILHSAIPSQKNLSVRLPTTCPLSPVPLAPNSPSRHSFFWFWVLFIFSFSLRSSYLWGPSLEFSACCLISMLKNKIFVIFLINQMIKWKIKQSEMKITFVK